MTVTAPAQTAAQTAPLAAPVAFIFPPILAALDIEGVEIRLSVARSGTWFAYLYSFEEGRGDSARGNSAQAAVDGLARVLELAEINLRG